MFVIYVGFLLFFKRGKFSKFGLGERFQLFNKLQVPNVVIIVGVFLSYLDLLLSSFLLDLFSILSQDNLKGLDFFLNLGLFLLKFGVNKILLLFNQRFIVGLKRFIWEACG